MDKENVEPGIIYRFLGSIVIPGAAIRMLRDAYSSKVSVMDATFCSFNSIKPMYFDLVKHGPDREVDLLAFMTFIGGESETS